MANPSNLYAEKVFSEHPISLWALDDQVDYISLITDSQRHIENWTVTGATATNNSSAVDDPFPTSPTTKFVATLPSTQYGQIKVVSPNLIKFEDLSSALETFSIGTYIYSLNNPISYEIGYEFTDAVSSNTVEVTKRYESEITGKWLFVSETFKSNKIGNDPEYVRLVIKINYIVSGSPVGGYVFYVNGTSFGQWSEEFATTSLGQSATDLPSTLSSLNTEISTGVPANQKKITAAAYGLSDSNGYYLTDGHSMFAKNFGVPLVYGASSSTAIFPNHNGLRPSLVLPSQGFLNNSGRHNDYTAEFWIRLDNRSSAPRRIFGPIVESAYLADSEALSTIYPDGIYVDGPFVKIKVGDSIGSHFVGEWSRPMLFDFKVADGVAGLMINGEQVISMTIDLKTLALPAESVYVSGISDLQDQNWVGFYAYDDIPKIEIDCVAIYSYQVSAVLAKRRFAYGQAVEFPEGANTAYGGTSAFIDYPFASYTNNYSYPDVGKFGSGIVDNATISTKSISSPQFSLPEIVFLDNETTLDSWNEHNQALSATAGIPAAAFGSEYEGYLFFSKLNVLKEDVKAVYGIFTAYEHPSEKQLLIKIQNRTTGDYFQSYILGNQVFYELKFNGASPETLYSEGEFVIGDQIFCNIDIEALTSFYGSDITAFFGNKSQLMMYVGSTPDFDITFNGQINKIGFCTAKNLKAIKKYFNNTFSGVPSYDAGESYYGSLASFWSEIVDGGSPSGSFINSGLYSHTASYTLVPKNNYGNFGLSIATSSYWEDYVPLSFLSQYVDGISGDSTYDLDFIQFNVGYPALPVYSGSAYDTSSSLVKTYVTFRYASEAPSNFEDKYVNTIPAQKNGVVSPGTYVIGYTDQNAPIYDNFYNTRYEVVDGLIIYPPAGVNVNKLVMATHIQIVTDGAQESQVKIKSLQYASESFNSYIPNPIGTRFGNKIYPYRKYGLYYDYNGRNPYRIYKGSTPYLYLTRDSGIQKVGDSNSLISSGLEMPINENVADEYKIIAMQMAIRFNAESFPTVATQIFEIQGKDSYTRFFVVANDTSGKRGRIYAINSKTGQVENGIAFYLNGNLVREPVISLESWAFLGINFQKSIDLNGYVGAFRITGQMLTNIVSIYKSTNLQEVQKSDFRPWSMIKTSALVGDLAWSYWKSNFTWNGLLVAASLDYYGIDPSTIYKIYTGTNKLIVDDSKKIKVADYEYGIYSYGATNAKIINAV